MGTFASCKASTEIVATRKLGKYEVIERLGRGGMAEVYRAYHVSLDRFVAIKVLHAFLADDPEFKTRFEKEARNIARLKHPNIVQVYDFETDEESESYYMVMELVEGPTLKGQLFRLSEQGELMPLNEALRIIREAAGALAYAHSQGMIHRDVKPANLMLDRDNRVVLADFGIAKIVTGVQFTASGGMVGTPAYMAPEQGLGEAGDERSDLYSLGVILFQLLTGKLPYDAETPLAVILKHLNEPIPSARRLNPDLPESIDVVLHRLLAKDPDDRYQSATELIGDLEKIERGETVEYKDTILVNKPPIEEQDTQELAALSEEVRQARRRQRERRLAAQNASGGRRIPAWYWLIFGLVVLAGVALFVSGGGLGVLLASASPTETATSTATGTPTPTEVFTLTPPAQPSPTLRVMNIPTEMVMPFFSPTPTDTVVPPTATETPTPSETPTVTYTPSITLTPSVTLTPTLNLTLTLIQATMVREQQTATYALCNFDYRIVEQSPADGEFYVADARYEREIVLQNTGTCAWERLTALVFVPGSGVSFSVEPPYIFIAERVEVGDTTTIRFVGRTPPTACRENNDVVDCSGQWELRTPGQILIGDEPLTIRVRVYEGG